jgi:hypothetical protein
MLTDDEMFRNVAADCMMQGFIVEALFANYLRSLPDPEQIEAIAAIDTEGKYTGHFKGVLKDDPAGSEKFSDVVVRMHRALDRFLLRAVKRSLAQSLPQ